MSKNERSSGLNKVEILSYNFSILHQKTIIQPDLFRASTLNLTGR